MPTIKTSAMHMIPRNVTQDERARSLDVRKRIIAEYTREERRVASPQVSCKPIGNARYAIENRHLREALREGRETLNVFSPGSLNGVCADEPNRVVGGHVKPSTPKNPLTPTIQSPKNFPQNAVEFSQIAILNIGAIPRQSGHEIAPNQRARFQISAIYLDRQQAQPGAKPEFFTGTDPEATNRAKSKKQRKSLKQAILPANY